MKQESIQQDSGKIECVEESGNEKSILENDIYLKLVLGTEGGSKNATKIVKYINEQLGEKWESSNRYKHLEKLVKANILSVDSFKERKRTKDNGIVRDVRSNIYYSINYVGLSEFFFDKILFKAIINYDISSGTKRAVKDELMNVFPSIVQTYLSNLKKYYDLKNPSLKTQYLVKKKNLEVKDNLLNSLQFIDKPIFREDTPTLFNTMPLTTGNSVVSLKHDDFVLKDFADGLFRCFQKQPEVLHQMLVTYYKKKDRTFDYKPKVAIGLFLSMIDFYFSRNKGEILAMISEHYGDCYLEDFEKRESQI